MKLLDENKISKLPNPDYFKTTNSNIQLREQVKDYKAKLSTYLFLSSFAFFENYIGSVLHEIFEKEFHIIDSNSINECLTNPNLKTSKSILSGSTDNRHINRYIKYSEILRQEKYIQPKELISSIAVEKLLSSVDNLKANEIPIFLKGTLNYPISETEKNKFGTYRDLRNRIAHGENPELKLSDVNDANKFLRKFAASIDYFLTEHYIKPINYKE